MKYFKALLNFLLAIVRALLYGWALALAYFVRLALEAIGRRREMRHIPARERRMSRHECAPVSDPAYRRPDPMIYDQFYLMQQGFAVAWDNPDIQLREAGIPVSSHALKPNTTYDIVARIWNNSTQAPVMGLPVRFSFLSFGIGTVSHFIADTQVDLGVKGGLNHPAFATVAWKTPPTPGHYCVQVSFEWIDDVNPYNNLGQENTDVAVAHSAADFTFELRNDTEDRQLFRFETDAYTIPPLPSCNNVKPNRRPLQSHGRTTLVPPQHVRGRYPLPPGWKVLFDPAEPQLGPGENISVTARVISPDDFRGEQALNFHAFHQRGLAGGLTALITSGG